MPDASRGREVAGAGDLSTDARMPLPSGVEITAAGIEAAKARNGATTVAAPSEEPILRPPIPVQDIGMRPGRARRSDYASDDEYYAARQAQRQRRHAFQDEMRRLVREITSLPTSGYDSEQAVEAWAAARGVVIDRAFYDVADPRLMDCVVSTLDALMGEYPQVLELFRKSGSEFRIGTDTYSYDAMNASGGLNVSPHMARSYAYAVEDFVTAYTRGEYSEELDRDLRQQVRGNGALQTEVAHEFGHNLDNAIREQFVSIGRDGYRDIDFDRLFRYRRELIELTRSHTTSSYALTNDLEAFAEGFAEYSTNPTSEYGAAFGEFLRRWLPS